MALPGIGVVSTTLLTLFSIFVFYFLRKFYRVRSYVHMLEEQGMPMPKHSMIFGHLLEVKALKDKLPSDANGFHLSVALSKQFPDSDSLFYLDLWPFSEPFITVGSPSTCMQASQRCLSKPQDFEDLLKPVTGGRSLLTMKGEEWKMWRTIFNPGFSSGYLLDNISDIVNEVSVFCETLRDHAQRRNLVRMEEITGWLTLDILGKIILNTRLNSQRSKSSFASAMRSQIQWLSYNDKINPWERWHPLRPIIQWLNGRIMNNIVLKELDRRLEELQSNSESKPNKSMIDLALENYMAKNSSSRNGPVPKMDTTMKLFTARQIRLFIFAGSDSTSSVLCYCYYMLSSNPASLTRLRVEHDEVFGTDLSTIANTLIQKPHLLNQLPYTQAVIKEVLRLFPPAATLREGAPGISITDPQGQKYPTENCYVWVLHQALHSNPTYWKEPDSFLPERWLITDPSDPLYPLKNSWRPFEQGPQNCIGQNLALLEVRTALVMTVREFRIKAAYAEWDAMHPARGRPRTVGGERAYQVDKGGAHPADGLPCRVEFNRTGSSTAEKKVA